MNSESLATRHRSHLFLLALVVIFAGFLRFFGLSAEGYWTDEFCTLSASHGWGLQLYRVPVDQIAPSLPVCTRLRDAWSTLSIPSAMAKDDAHPPLYFLLLRLWEKIFGDDEAAVRSLNVVFSLLATILLYFVARDSVGSFAALTACLLMAVATPQIQYSQEARNYMPVLVFALLAAMAIENLRRSPARAWAVLLGFSLLAMMLTHYFAAGAAGGLTLYMLFVLRRRARRYALIATAIAGLLFALLWGRQILEQRSVFQNGLGWLADPGPGHVRRRIYDLLRLPVRFFVEITDPSVQRIIAVTGLMMLLALPILFARRRELRLWICWLVAAIGLVAVADFSRSTTQLNWVRYTIFATPAAYVLLSSALNRRRWKLLLPGVAVIAALLNLKTAYVPQWKKDFRTPVQIVANRIQPGDGLIISGPDPIADGIMFAAFQHYLPAMPAATAVLTRVPDSQTVAHLQQCPHVWVIRMWPDQHISLPNFQVREQQAIPYFAVIVQGRFEPAGMSP